ncbi:hypothetical protein SynRCC2555_01762 [Synechococcus sp. WH 8101]|nr:hypothetical protein SynRCC2555_01762 [Synechococcus sp. WH 8101]
MANCSDHCLDPLSFQEGGALADGDLLHHRSGDAKVDRRRLVLLRACCSPRSGPGSYG